MDKDEIIRMFHEAGELAGWKPGVGNPLVINYLTHFAALVATHEREKQAEQEPECYVTGNLDDFPEGEFNLYAAPVRTKDLTEDVLQDAVTKALRKAFHLGQTYCQRCNSESNSKKRKAAATLGFFLKLEDDTRAVIAADREKNK